MKCPQCLVEMAISNSRYKLETENGAPKLFIEQDLSCRSRQCVNYGKVVKMLKHPLAISNESTKVPETDVVIDESVATDKEIQTEEPTEIIDGYIEPTE